MNPKKLRKWLTIDLLLLAVAAVILIIYIAAR